MLKSITLALATVVTFAMSSCCYCVIQVPGLYPIPEDWELIEICDGDTIEVIPSDK